MERRENFGRRRNDKLFATYLAMDNKQKAEVYEYFNDCGDMLEAIEHVAKTFELHTVDDQD